MSSSASSAVRENASGVLYDLLTDAAGAGLLIGEGGILEMP